jgi:hypothetical protein
MATKVPRITIRKIDDALNRGLGGGFRGADPGPSWGLSIANLFTGAESNLFVILPHGLGLFDEVGKCPPTMLIAEC